MQVAFALREALAELREAGGWQTRQNIYRQRAEIIYKELTSINIDTLLKNNEYSCVLRSYCLPSGVTYTELHDKLKNAGFVIYAGQGELAEAVFRIAHMGEIDTEDLQALCIALRSALGSRA